MATIKSSFANGKSIMPIPNGQEVMNVRIAVALTALQAVNANVVEFGELPADCVPVDYKIAATDLDTGATPTIAFDVGILNAAGTAVSATANDGGAKWVAASTLAQAGGLLLATASKAAWDILGVVAPVEAGRKLGLVFTAGAATAAAGTVTLEVSYKSA